MKIYKKLKLIFVAESIPLFVKIGVFQDQPILLKLEVYFRTERERERGPSIITARNIHDVRLRLLPVVKE